MIERQWWEQRWFLLLFVMLSTVPLLYPAVPVWGDMPAHLAMDRVALEHGDASSPLNQYFAFAWKIQGNMGADLLVVPLALLLPLEVAAKLVLVLTIALTSVGILALSREVHGRVSPVALFAVPLAYSFTFQFGMANYALSMALALGGHALWLRWRRMGRRRLRAVVFMVASPLVWLCHIYGWAVLCVLCFMTELWDNFQRDDGIVVAVWRTILASLVLASPLALTLIWRSGGTEFASGWFDVKEKLSFMRHSLSAVWPIGEVQSLFVKIALLAVLAIAMLRQRRFSLARRMRLAIGTLGLLFLLLPTTLLGSYAADGRLFPYIVIVAVLSLDSAKPDSASMRGRVAGWGVGFALVQFVALTISFAVTADAQERRMAVLARLPVGARLVSFVGGGEYCHDHEYNRVMNHLPSMAIVRRRAFANDQFQNDQLMRVIYPPPAVEGRTGAGREPRDYYHDESQLIDNPDCRRSAIDRALAGMWKRGSAARGDGPPQGLRSADYTLGHVPRDKFDYLWLIAPPAIDPRLLSGMTQIARAGDSTLFAIDHDVSSRKLAAVSTPQPHPQRP